MGVKPNIKVVASLAGVSISSVSRAMNHPETVSDELREKVTRAIEETGFSINPMASTLKSTRRNQIAIVIPSLRQNAYTDLIKGISKCCYERNVLPITVESAWDNEKERSIIESLEKQWVDGIIFVPGKEKKQSRKFIRSLSGLTKNNEKIPVVMVESDCGNDALDSVRVDYQYAYSTLTEHLVGIGRKKFLYLAGEKDASMLELSLQGIRSVLDGAGLSGDLEIRYSGFTVLDGYRTMIHVLSEGKSFDAVICANDQMASGVLRACQERKVHVPEDIALVGFGGVALSIITTPSITTMTVPNWVMGYRAANMVFERIDKKRTEVENVLMRPKLAVRTSTLSTADKSMEAMFAE